VAWTSCVQIASQSILQRVGPEQVARQAIFSSSHVGGVCAARSIGLCIAQDASTALHISNKPIFTNACQSNRKFSLRITALVSLKRLQTMPCVKKSIDRGSGRVNPHESGGDVHLSAWQ